MSMSCGIITFGSVSYTHLDVYKRQVYTIIDMATAYGSALGLDSTGLLLALLATQFVAFPCSILFGKLAKKHAAEKLIGICIAAYFGIAIFAMFLQHQWQFWMLAVLLSLIHI